MTQFAYTNRNTASTGMFFPYNVPWTRLAFAFALDPHTVYTHHTG